VYIYRDLRDVAFSLAHRFNTTLEHVVREKRLIQHSIENDEFWRSQPRVLCQQYHQVIENPIGAILELAKHLGLNASSELAKSVAHQYSFTSNFARTMDIAERFASQGVDLSDPLHSLSFDEHTLLGWNHMRQGRQGGWRDEVTQEQLVTLLAACGEWLILRGYESDCSWAWKGRALLNADEEGAARALRGLLQQCERDSRQIVRLQEEIAQLTDRFREVSSRVSELEQLSPRIRQQAARLQAMFTRYPRIRALLKSLSSRQGSVAKD
jgi:Sulfotransferase domain